MSYLPPSSLYLHEPQPAPRPEPHPEPHREPEAHLEPLRLTERVPFPTAPPIPAAPPHMYVTSPSIPHTVERIIDPPQSRMPTMPPMSPAMTPPPHVVEHVTERVIERPNEAPQVIERVVERFIEQPPEPTPPPHVVEHVTERVIERPHEAPQVIERVVERYIEQPPEPTPPPRPVQHVVERVVERPHEAPQVIERVVERFVEKPPEPTPPPQVIERIIERVIERPPPEPAHDVTPPAPTPAPVLSSAMPPLHAVKGPKDWLVASPPEFRVEEHAEPRRIHVEESVPEPVPELVPVPRVEERHEPRHEPRHEERPEPRREPRHEPKPVHAARPEHETRPAPKAKRHLLHRAHRTVMRHLRRDKSQPPEPGDKELLWLGASALGSVCVGLMIWGAYSMMPRPGYGGGLRAELTSPKFKVVNGEYGPGRYEPVRAPRIETPILTGLPGPVRLPPPPPEPPRRIVDTPQVHFPPPEPRIPPIQVERALDALPRRLDPAIFVKANLGDTPMIRTWDNLAKYSMMLTAMAAVPAMPIMPQAFAQPMPQVLQPPPQAPAVDYSKQIDALTQAVNRLTTDVNRLKDIDDKIDAVRSDVSKQIAKIKVEPHDDSEIKLQLASIQKTLKFLLENPQAAPVAAPGVAAAPSPANTSRIEAELVMIKEAILKLQPSGRLALSMPGDLTPPTITKTARIVFVNLYDKDLYLWVNDKKHRVDAQKTITVENVTPGAANIEVKSQDAVYHRASPTLAANETYTLTAR